MKQSLDGFGRITIDPETMNGQPCIRGMRVTVRRVLELLPDYPDWASLITDYPELKTEDIAEALRFAAQSLARGPDQDCTGRVEAIAHHKTLEQDPALALWLLETLLTHAPMGFAFFDRELRFVRINERLAEINGYSVAEHLGRTVAEILPTLAPALNEVAAHILATGQPVLDHEFSGETASAPGVARHWNASWYPVRDERDEIIGFGSVVVEITARKQAEAAQRHARESLNLAAKASKVVFYQQDLELRFRWLHNPLPGFEASKIIGQLDADVLERADEAARVEALKREVLRSGVGHREDMLLHVQNLARHYDVLIEPMRDDAGIIAGVTGAAIDITERKHAEAAQRETERQHRALADASSEIPYRVSADWSTLQPLDGRDLVASSGRALADWAWVDQYLPRDEQARVRQAIGIAIAGKCLFELEHRVLQSDGSTGWVRSRAVPILDENQDLVTWFGTFIDITQRKLIEANLIEATAAAENANRAKSEFLSSMSHELRTPLNSILGFAQLMESATPAPTPAQKRGIEHILRGGWYLLGLIEEILDLALIESGKLSLTQEPVSLAELMLECRAMMEPLASTRGIDMTFPSVAPPGYARADRIRVKQILINLLSNAIKYNRAQGAVTVECALSPPGAIRVSVRDTGEGLVPEKLAQLFQSFNRLGKEGGPEAGTGIGLVMSRRLVELMGGTIGAESTPGVGSVFWFELKWASTLPAASQ